MLHSFLIVVTKQISIEVSFLSITQKLIGEMSWIHVLEVFKNRFLFTNNYMLQLNFFFINFKIYII